MSRFGPQPDVDPNHAVQFRVNKAVRNGTCRLENMKLVEVPRSLLDLDVSKLMQASSPPFSFLPPTLPQTSIRARKRLGWSTFPDHGRDIKTPWMRAEDTIRPDGSQRVRGHSGVEDG